MMVLNIHLPGATPHDLGDEIWQESLANAIRAEAEIIAACAGADLLESQRPRSAADMTAMPSGRRYAAGPVVMTAVSVSSSPNSSRSQIR